MATRLWWVAALSIRIGVNLVLAAAVVLFVALGAGPRVLGYRTLTVLSGSMRPGIPPGSVIVVHPVPTASLAVGQTITYVAPVPGEPVVTHRIVQITKKNGQVTIRTKGDANPGADPWTARLTSATAWRTVAVLARLGYAINTLRQPVGRALTLALTPAAMAYIWLRAIWSKNENTPDAVARHEPAVDARRHPPAHRRRRHYSWPLAALSGIAAAIAAALTIPAWAMITGTAGSAHSLSSASLAAPTNPNVALAACSPGGTDAATVTWTPTSSQWADGYLVMRADTPGAAGSIAAHLTGQATSSYTDVGLALSRTYYYSIEATKHAWTSTPTAEVAVTTRDGACPPA
ncbi:MAG: signal peptidase I [Acidimicrobiales bacterium]